MVPGDSFLDSDPLTPRRERKSDGTIFRAEVRERRNTDSVVCASANDFVVADLRPSSAAEASADRVLPYCFDIPNRRSIYAGVPERDEIFAAPFYYLEIRRRARRVYSVPWSLGPLFPAAVPVAPVFVFSVGRCGTTLLSRILHEAGIPSASEPDFYTQFTAGALFENNPQFYGTEVKAALAHLTCDLAQCCSSDAAARADRPLTPVIKLRSESCFITRFLVSMFPPPHRAIFMYRDFEPWARSTLRNFDYPPRQVLSKYLSGLKSLTALDKLGACHVLHYERLLAEPDAVCAALGDFLGYDISRAAIGRALAGDAQDGTPLARGAHAGAPDLAEKLAQTLALWQAPHMEMMRNLLRR